MKNVAIGRQIRHIRTAKKISLQKLAGPTQLTSSFLSQVERDLVFPSINSLGRIANTLGVNIGEFFEDNGKDFTFIKKDKAPKVIDKKTKSSYEILASSFLGINMEPLLVRLEKGGEVKKGLLSEEGDIFFMVLEGKVQLVWDTERLVLSEKDSGYSKGQRRPKKILNKGSKKVILLWVKSSR